MPSIFESGGGRKTMVGFATVVAILGALIAVSGLAVVLATKFKQVGALALVIGALFVAMPFIVPSTGGGPLTAGDGAGTAISPTTGAPVQPIITTSTTGTFAAVDALSQGTTVNTVNRISVNGAAFSTGQTAFSQGDKLDVLFENVTRYHSAYVKGYIVPNAVTFTLNGKNYANATGVTMTVFNTNGQVITNVAPQLAAPVQTQNQTVTAGGAYTMEFTIDGSDEQSTQDMQCILEATNGTAARLMKVTGLGSKEQAHSKPSWYTLGGTNSKVWVYDLDPVTGAGRTTGSMYIQSESGATLAGIGTGSRGYVSCYTKEWFWDPLGDIRYGTTNSDNTLMSLASYRYGVQFSA